MSQDRYAKGYHSKAECMRCGKKMNYLDLLDDAQVPGLRVCSECWDPWHPQLDPIPADDAIALWRPSPDVSISDNYKETSPSLCFDTQGCIVFAEADFTTSIGGFTGTFTNTTNAECLTESSWAWNFGDGQTSTLENPMNTYLSNNSYTVTLVTTFTDTSFSTATQIITIDAVFTDWILLPVNLGVAGAGTTSRRAVATDGSGKWLSGNTNALLSVSTDDGLTWVQSDVAGYNSGGTETFTIGTNGTGIWMIGSLSGHCARSTDDLSNYVVMTRYANANAAAAQIGRFTHVGGNNWVCGMANGYASRSTDNGANWTELSPVGLNSTVIGSCFDQVWDGIDTIVRVQSFIFAARSVDNGVTWSGVTLPISAAGVATYGAGDFVAVGSSGTWTKSTDQGATWTASASIGTSTGSFQDVVVLSTGEWLASTSSGTNKEMWHTADEGANWTDITDNLPTVISGDFFQQMAVGDNDTVILVASNAYSIRNPST